MVVYDWNSDVEQAFAKVPLSVFLIGAALYLPLIFFLQRVIKKPVGSFIEKPLILWNAFLAVASGYAALSVWRDLLLPLIRAEGLSAMVCSTSVYQHISSRFVIIFNLTKAVEWVDTLFLLLKKKDLGFLHVFHHLVTMLYCLHATLFSFQADGSGVWFCGMNLLVHTIMYGYWTVLPFAPGLRKFGIVVTLLQLSQMIVGVLVTVAVTTACPLSWRLNWHGDLFALAMYAVYFHLFLKLVLAKTRPTTTPAKQKTK